MGANGSKEAGQAQTQKPLQPTVSIGTPNPDSLERWRRDSVGPQKETNAAKASSGADTQALTGSKAPSGPAVAKSDLPQGSPDSNGSSTAVATADHTRSPVIASTQAQTSSEPPVSGQSLLRFTFLSLKIQSHEFLIHVTRRSLVKVNS